MKDIKQGVATYVFGFILSILLTIAAYFTVVNDILSRKTVILAIVSLAIAQLLVQLIFFLHLGQEKKPRYNFTVFLFMLLVVGIIVFGSLWIMANLDYNMMPKDMDSYMFEEEGIH